MSKLELKVTEIYSSFDEFLKKEKEYINSLEGILLFHGSNEIISDPKAQFTNANKYTDFGIGFYLTSIHEQAEKWSNKPKNRSNPIVNVYLYDCNGIEQDFSDNYTEEWLEFIYECRNYGRQGGNADVIIGRVADDDVWEELVEFINGKAGLEETLENILEIDAHYDREDDQYCFTNQKAIKSHLIYLGSYYGY